MYPYVHCSIMYNSQDMEASIDEWMDKKEVVCVCTCVCVMEYWKWKCQLFNCVRLFATAWTIALQVPLFMGFSRQDYWNGLQCPPPGDLSNPGIEPASLMSPALAGGFFTTSTTTFTTKPKPIHLQSINLWKGDENIQWVSSASGVGAAGQLHVNQWSHSTLSHHT